MNPVKIQQVNVGASTPVYMDRFQSPFNVAINVRLVSGTVTDYTVEHTFDDILNPAITPNWFENSAFMTAPPAHNAASAFLPKDMNYAFPVVAIRVRIIAVTGAGTVEMSVIQASNVP
jgi:hypothetical protein